MNHNVQIIETKTTNGLRIWRILVNGQAHPVDFVHHGMALAHMGLLRSRGFQEGTRAA